MKVMSRVQLCMSPISALGLLNRIKIPLNDLKEKVVTIGTKEVRKSKTS
jgi:hypothetical protein